MLVSTYIIIKSPKGGKIGPGPGPEPVSNSNMLIPSSLQIIAEAAQHIIHCIHITVFHMLYMDHPNMMIHYCYILSVSVGRLLICLSQHHTQHFFFLSSYFFLTPFLRTTPSRTRRRSHQRISMESLQRSFLFLLLRVLLGLTQPQVNVVFHLVVVVVVHHVGVCMTLLMEAGMVTQFVFPMVNAIPRMCGVPRARHICEDIAATVRVFIIFGVMVFVTNGTHLEIDAKQQTISGIMTCKNETTN